MGFSSWKWINEPKEKEISETTINIKTEPKTDFWQRTYYGFRFDNSPALLTETEKNFTFIVKVSFEYKNRYDQCGLIIYIDSENWFKASIEYENDEYSRLGSVVTNLGYSDWATTDISTKTEIWYRLSRRGPDFLIEYSEEGQEFTQMRIFHLHNLGETKEEMGKLYPSAKAEKAVRFGLYACSPLDSSFLAVFSEMRIEKCKWLAHSYS